MSKTEKEYFRVTSNKVGESYFMVDKDSLDEALEEAKRQFRSSDQITHVKISKKKGIIET